MLNAVKFRAEEPPQLTIGAGREGEGWTISVRDNGIGVSENNRERIFEIFARGQADEAYPGTGLGHAVCQKIVDRHHGRIWVEPSPGGGTGSVFCFTLPDVVAP